MKEIIHDPEAECDLVGGVRFYESREAGLGARFLRELDETIMKIARDPEAFAFYERPLRSCKVPDFPCRVIYADEMEFILIVAVSHLSRQPGWWRYRVHR